MEEKRERKPMGVLGKSAIGYIAVLSVVLRVINVLELNGYVPVSYTHLHPRGEKPLPRRHPFLPLL